MDEIFELVKNIIAEIVKIKKEKIKRDSGLSCNLGIDSMTFEKIIAESEKIFNMTILQEKVKKVETVQDLCKVIKNIKMENK